LDDGVLVRVTTAPKHADPVDMFVVGVGSKWVLGLSVVDGHFDGHVAVRMRDVLRVRRDSSFFTRMARTLPDWPPAAQPDAPLDSTGATLRWFGERYPLLGIEQARQRPALWIGALGSTPRTWFALHEVDSHAEWHLSPLYYKRKKTTAITGGTRYMLALASVAGPAPAVDPSRSGR
jgi:hypothetical protein